MKNLSTNQKKPQHNSRQSLLESTKLSRIVMPDFDNAPMKTVTMVVVCVGCGGRLESDNDFQQSVKVCRKCLVHYAKIDSAIDEASKRKRREILERFTAAGECLCREKEIQLKKPRKDDKRTL